MVKDECSSNPCLNGATCIDKYNGYACRCPPNWQGTTCNTDVNECIEFIMTPDGCQNGATCFNTLGSFSCQCSPDWNGIHCTEPSNDCSAASNHELCGHGTCINRSNRPAGQAAYTCICDHGWTTDGHNPACNVDINECTTGRHFCSQNPLVECINIPGDFRCASCPAGYTGNGFTCTDINECLIYNGGCSQSPLVLCTNNLGSRQCGPCPEGYQGDGVTCIFYGICRTNNGGCHPLATCMENAAISSSYKECRCPPGYVGPGIGYNGCVLQSGGGGGGTALTPAPFNPCDSNPCLRGTCVATGPYSFRCNCPVGFEGQRCELDWDDCASAPCLNGATCVNQQNGYACQCSPYQTGTNCEQDIDACGSYFTSMNGTIRYPSSTLLVYEHSRSCAWVITTVPHMVLNLTFPEFHLEYDTYCRYDFLQLNDGDSSISHPLGRFCGTNPPNGGNVITTHNSVYVWFHSDSSVAHDGFRIDWRTVEPVCGGDLNVSDHGVVSSPGYPGQYPRDRDCVWTIKVPLGKQMKIAFARLEMEPHENCNYDYLEIRDGLRETDPVLGNLLCGMDATVPEPLQTSGPYARLHFHSDHSQTANGFQITYLSVPGVAGCGGLWTTETGAFTSPDHPNSHAPNLECDYEIRLRPQDKIQLTFTSFNLEFHQRCNFDYIEIFDGEDTTPTSTGRYCGSNLPPVHISRNNKLFVKFVSDYSQNLDGFRATYVSVCGGTFTEPHGLIHSPNYPEPYPGSRECVYVIRQPPGKAIEMHFLAFDIENMGTYNNECRFDYLLVRDGDDETFPLKGKFCGTDIPDNIISTHNVLWIQFVTDSSVHNRGFLVNYTTIDIACGAILTELSGVIMSPSSSQYDTVYGYQGNNAGYMYDANCHWVIRPPSGYIVRLTFTSFALEDDSECRYDYIVIYDNTTTEDVTKRIGPYCGHTPPPVITSSDNLMVVVFHSDSSIAHDGFAIHYVAFDASSTCGGNYFTTTGTIRSPNYPNRYPHNSHCIWKIDVEAGHQILLNISKFQLEYHRNCQFDNLEIRNGGYSNSPLIGKFCDVNIPRIITSHGNQLWMKFNSDSSSSADGFEINWDGTTTGCGGELTSSQGSIASPNYPESCNAAIDCTWRITVGRGNKIKIGFSELSLPSSERCLYGGLEIYNGKSLHSPLLHRICGSAIAEPIVSESHELFLRYRCGQYMNNEHNGFLLTYETACHVHLSGRRGVIDTPNFPYPYPHNQNCTWQIEGPKGNGLNISFTALELEEHPNCNYDFIAIYDKKNHSTLGPYCSVDQVPRHLSIDSNVISISFISDFSRARNGFSLEWVASGCGGDFRKPVGTFATPNYPENYPLGIMCDWEISTEPGNSIEVTIQNYDMESTRNCNFDSLSIYGGIGTNAPLLHNICHRQMEPVHITSSGNHMYLRFVSDNSVVHKGFNASYIVKPDACGGRITSDSGSIHSRNYPANYNPNDDCSWQITVLKGHTVKLNFTDFEVLPQANNCSAAHVAIYDGPDEFSPLLMIHCGSYVPTQSMWNSTNNQMFIQMRGHGVISARGFIAVYETGCGAILNADERGDFGVQDIDFQKSWRSQSTCTWIIKAKTLEDKITLMITSIDAVLSAINCSARSLLDVFDGELNDSPVLLRLCTDHIPPAVTSHGSVIRVVSYHYYGQLFFRATYYEASAGCGGDFDAISGTFVSPDYPNFYPVQTECVWTIKTAPGHRTMLSFNQFDLEESEYCNKDYMEIRENDEGGRLIGSYCGQELPANLTAAHQLWIKFRSDLENGGQGFVASFSLLFRSYPNGTSGEIASPLYPKMFSSVGIYEWSITVPQNMFVQATFLDSNMYAPFLRRSCLVSLKFYDSADDTGEELATYCGSEELNPVISNGNQMFVRFNSRISYLIRGSSFLLKWNATFSRRIYPTGPQPAVITDSDCGGVITMTNTTTLTLSSPGYPDGYADNKNCEWLVTSPIGTRLVFTFTALDLQAYYFCHYADNVEFYGGSAVAGQWENLGQFCSRRHVDQVVISGSNTMKVIFSSNSWRNGTGFSGRIMPVCGGNITDSSGSILTPNYPNNYYDHAQCEWLISVRPGRTIQLRSDDFQLEGDSPTCIRDYLIIRNGMSDIHPLLGSGKYCGESGPTVLDTTSNHLHMRFVSNGNFRFKGFKLLFKEVSAECGGRQMLSETVPSVRLETPNYPNPYPNQTQCEWTIIAPPLSRVRLDFEDHFDILFHSECVNDYVAIYDGGTPHSPHLGRLCGHDLPATVQASGNLMFISFSSSDSHPATGFRATAKIASCGGTISGSSGSIMSPNYPQDYPNGLDCEWIVRGPVGHFLIFTMNDLQTATDQNVYRQINCSNSDSVSIRDINKDGNLLGEFCGDQLPLPCETASNIAYVRFISIRNSRVMRGFRLLFNSSVEECGGLLSTPNGIITSPNYPNFYPNHRDCQWEIHAPRGRRVELAFTHMDLQSQDSGRCYDYVMAYNFAMFDSDYSVLHYQYICGSGGELPVVTSGSSYMKVKFHSDSEISGTGFSARYNTDLENECGGDLPLPSGTVASYNYSHNLICEWNLFGDRPDATFVVQFHQMIIEGTQLTSRHQQVCLFDRFDIFAASDVESGFPFMSLCGNISEPPTIALPFSSVVFRFKTDISVAHLGFNLSYSINNCGGELTEGGVITSPGFPTSYGNNLHCAWAVRFEEGQQVQITFEDFQLESVADCTPTADKVIVHNGRMASSPIIGTYCGNHIPPQVTSQRHEIVIVFSSNAANAGRGFSLHVTPVSSGCGGVFHGSGGVITSVNYPGTYPASTVCEWTFDTKLGFSFRLTFAGRFDLEMSSSCVKDYVEGFEHVGNQWVSRGRRCGRNVPDPYILNSPKFRLLFVTDEANEGDGFRALWNETCGGVFTDMSGTFSSPQYPAEYLSNLNCTYVISPDPSHYVVLAFDDDFLLEPSSDCIFDAVEIYAGNDTNGRLMGTFCNEVPGMLSLLGAITVRLRTDSSQQHRGFRAHYNVSACGGIFNHSNEARADGRIASPMHPDRYYPYMNCTWIIEVKPNRVINFRFEKMNVETGWSNCEFDHVSLFDGNNTLSPQLGRFCGFGSIPFPLSSTDNIITVQFATDYEGEHEGFKAVYRSTFGVRQGCGGVLNTTHGAFQSLDFDGDSFYEAELFCEWTIIGSPFMTLELTFETSFDVEKPPNRDICPWDYLEIRDGPSADSNLIDRLCGNTMPNPITSSTNQLWLRFVSDDTGNHTGFQATYRSIAPLCGGFFTATDMAAVMQSRNYPESYPMNERCRWTFNTSSAETSIIEFHFDDLRLEESPRCNKDRLTFHNVMASFHRRETVSYCGNAKPSDLFVDASHATYVEFLSDSSTADKGFQIHYKIASCNRTYVDPYGEIKRFKSPSRWDRNFYHDDDGHGHDEQPFDCYIHISVPENRTITLNIESFFINIYRNENCETASLEVRDGSTETAPLLEKLCGYHSQISPLYSTGHEMWLRLHIISASHHYILKSMYYSSDKGPGCGGEMVLSQGGFASPGHPGNYSVDAVCIWKVSVPNTNRITVDVSYFDIRSGENCTDSSLQLYEGDIESDTHLVNTFCDTEHPSIVRIESSKFIVKYVTTPRNSGLGFRLNFYSTAVNQEEAGPPETVPKNNR